MSNLHFIRNVSNKIYKNNKQGTRVIISKLSKWTDERTVRPKQKDGNRGPQINNPSERHKIADLPLLAANPNLHNLPGAVHPVSGRRQRPANDSLSLLLINRGPDDNDNLLLSGVFQHSYWHAHWSDWTKTVHLHFVCGIVVGCAAYFVFCWFYF